jgi:hypothetical protein
VSAKWRGCEGGAHRASIGDRRHTASLPSSTPSLALPKFRPKLSSQKFSAMSGAESRAALFKSARSAQRFHGLCTISRACPAHAARRLDRRTLAQPGREYPFTAAEGPPRWLMLRSIAQPLTSQHPHLCLRCHCLNSSLQGRTLFMDRSNHRPHWHTDIHQNGFG